MMTHGRTYEPGRARRLIPCIAPPIIQPFSSSAFPSHPQINLSSSTYTVERLAEKFNYKPFELWLGPQHCVVVSEPDVVRQVMRKRPVTFRRSAQVSAILNGTWGAPGLFTAEGNDWSRQRRLTAPLFNKLNASSMVT